jgi:pullulanase/glycogen debranching enzyme
MGRTRQGNNNVYWQDSEMSWCDWGALWLKEMDTEIGWVEKEESFKAGDQIKVEARSLVVLRHASR